MWRDLVEFYSWRIALGMAIGGLFIWALYSTDVQKKESRCAEGHQAVEAHERCDAHEDCTPTRDDFLALAEAEKQIERYCEVEDAQSL